MKHLKNIFQGFTALATIGTVSTYPSLSSGFAKDIARLQNDKEQIIQGFNNKIKQEYGKQEYTVKS
ncbi:MAG: hypothetical protein IJR46_05230 [Neisseriaceae bacterium]|nr:hypothetical protein [Neisseriaceae bacterium]